MTDQGYLTAMFIWTTLGTIITLKNALKRSVKFYTEKTVEKQGGEILKSQPAIFKLKNKEYNIPDPDNPYLTDAEMSIYKSLVCLAQDIIPERRWLFIGLLLIIAGNIGTFLLSLAN